VNSTGAVELVVSILDELGDRPTLVFLSDKVDDPFAGEVPVQFGPRLEDRLDQAVALRSNPVQCVLTTEWHSSLSGCGAYARFQRLVSPVSTRIAIPCPYSARLGQIAR
jgi:hypothetical protein